MLTVAAVVGAAVPRYVAKKVRQLLAEPGVNATVIKPTCAPAAPMAIWVSAVVSFLVSVVCACVPACGGHAVCG